MAFNLRPKSKLLLGQFQLCNFYLIKCLDFLTKSLSLDI